MFLAYYECIDLNFEATLYTHLLNADVTKIEKLILTEIVTVIVTVLLR